MNPLALLFNRAPKYVPGPSLASEKEKAAKNPSADPLASLTANYIETDYRLQVNRGLYATPAWAFHELSRTCSILGDKVRFWKAQVAALEWHVAVAKDADETNPDADPAKVKLARKQADALRTAYESLTNLKAVLKHLAGARFYGYAAVRKAGNSLQLIDPWNVVRDLQWQGDTPPGMLWHYNQKASSSFRKTEMPEMKTAEYIVRECEDPSMLELLRLAFRANKVMDFRERNLEEASKNQIIILTGANMPEAGTTEYTSLISALESARRGESAVIAKGNPDCPTEIFKPDSAKGLPFYNSTLESIDQAMTKAVTGGMLTMLSMPQGIGAATANVQADTLKTLVADEAGDISETMQQGYDRFILEAANLLKPGERALAHFELSGRQEIDPQASAELLAQIGAAGWNVEQQQATEMLGMPVVKAQAPQMGDGINADLDAEEAEDEDDLPNRAAMISRLKEAEGLATMDEPFFAMLDRLAAKEGGDKPPTNAWFAKLEKAIQDAPPETLMDTTALEAYLVKAMIDAKAEADAQIAVDAPSAPAQDDPVKKSRKKKSAEPEA